MKPFPLFLVCAIVALTSPAQAVDPTIGTAPATATEAVPALPPTVRKRMAAHTGRKAVTAPDAGMPKKTKQEIADEKRLQQDLHICDGC